MRHCNSVFCAEDIWFLIDTQTATKRKLYLANCPICTKEMALYSEQNPKTLEIYEKYYYSGGARKIKDKLKKEISSTLQGFKTKYRAPYGFKYGKNIEIKKEGKCIGIKQYACDFWGNKVLVKTIYE